MKQEVCVLKGPENCKMGQKAGSIYKIKNKEEKNRKPIKNKDEKRGKKIRNKEKA